MTKPGIRVVGELRKARAVNVHGGNLGRTLGKGLKGNAPTIG